MREKPDEFAIIREIRRSLAEWLESSIEARLPVAGIMKNLDSLEDLLQNRPVTGGRKGGGSQRGRTRAKYTVEATPSGEVLTEGRPEGKSPPFRVSKELYGKVADILAATERPLRFEEISELMSQQGSAPSDFQIRVCLRFFLTHSPPLVTRNRNAYQAIDSETFSSKAQKSWAAART